MIKLSIVSVTSIDPVPVENQGEYVPVADGGVYQSMTKSTELM